MQSIFKILYRLIVNLILIVQSHVRYLHTFCTNFYDFLCLKGFLFVMLKKFYYIINNERFISWFWFNLASNFFFELQLKILTCQTVSGRVHMQIHRIPSQPHQHGGLTNKIKVVVLSSPNDWHLRLVNMYRKDSVYSRGAKIRP